MNNANNLILKSNQPDRSFECPGVDFSSGSMLFAEMILTLAADLFFRGECHLTTFIMCGTS